MHRKNTENYAAIIIPKTIIKMILYNVTSNIDQSIHEQWLQWMQEKHIPEILATGKFISAKLVRVLIEEEMGGLTYAAIYNRQKKHFKILQRTPRFREESANFGDKMLLLEPN
jgi:hypothetical protein